MSNVQLITRQTHLAKRWNRPSGYAFAANQALAPLAASELGLACLSLPVAFVAVGGEWVLAAVLGLPPSTSLCVAADGRWHGPYVPASIRFFPFSMGRTSEEQSALCVDESSGLVHAGPDGVRFFEEDGSPSETTAQILDALTRWEVSRKATAVAVAALQRHGLIKPWSITGNSPSGPRTLGGLARIDEEALNRLPAEALHDLMKHGALAVAYCQLLSTPHFQALARAGEKREDAGLAAVPQPPQAKPPSTREAVIPPNLLNASGDLNLDFLSKSDTVHFG